MARVIGIDPGLQHTGWAVIDSQGSSIKFLGAGVIHTLPGNSLPSRLLQIHNELAKVIVQYCPNDAAIEDTYINKNYASSLKLGHARAASILTLCINGLIPAEYPAKVIKRAIVGSGKADKTQVAYMLKFLVPLAGELASDASDALAVAICHSNYTSADQNRIAS